jgi:two-component system, NarL family, response regulator LiaR
MLPPSKPLRLAVVNDYEVVVAGIAAMLSEHGRRIRVVELDNRLPVVADVDIVLMDTFAQVSGDGIGLAELVRHARRSYPRRPRVHPRRRSNAGSGRRSGW